MVVGKGLAVGCYEDFIPPSPKYSPKNQGRRTKFTLTDSQEFRFLSHLGNFHL